MSDIKVVRSHSLPIAKAKALAQKMADKLAEEYDLCSEWHGDTLQFRRSGVTGRMKVTPLEIRLEANLGWPLKALKAKLVTEIEGHLDKIAKG